jgi:hypothetical protein
MAKPNKEVQNILIGLVVLVCPLVLIGFKYGVWAALTLLCGMIGTLFIAQLALFIFSKRSRLAKGVAVLIWPELIFKFLLPKKYNLEIAKMNENTVQSSNSSVNGDATRPSP